MYPLTLYYNTIDRIVIDWYDKTADFREFILTFIECKEKVYFCFQMKNEINSNIFNFIFVNNNLIISKIEK
ncbi:hypothetical protein BACERE00176_05795 [Bacillus paranthracis]|nr:hypothetical protein BACERE00176_05795 [Bacillus paranthracis]